MSRQTLIIIGVILLLLAYAPVLFADAIHQLWDGWGIFWNQLTT